ncbi:beta strand repeat-containing protein [Paraburkholderia sp. BR14261]
MNLTGGAVDVVGGATLASQGGFYNAGSVLAGGDLNVSGQNVVNAANASLVSVGTTTVNASNFTNAGLLNGTNTVVNVGGTLTNSGGSLMGLNALTINTGALNNQGGLIFAGNPTGGTTGSLSLRINGGNGSFGNASGSILAQANLGISAVNLAFDPSQGTISQGGQLSITASAINIGGDWNYSGTGVTLDGINGVVNNGKMSGTAPLTITTNGTFTNNNQVSGNDVTINGTLANGANALVHAGDVLTLNGNVANRGTIEAGTAINVTGGNYDNAGATTQSQGNITFNLGGTLQNTGGSIFAGNNINISAAAVVNDQTAPSGTASSTTTTTDPSLIWSAVAGTQTAWGEETYGGENGFLQPVSYTSTATLGDLLSPTGVQASGTNASSANASSPVAGSGTVVFNEYNVMVGQQSAGDGSYPVYQNLWYIGTAVDPTALSSVTLALPTIYSTSSTQQAGTSGVISAGNSISLTAGTLSNQGGQISAQGNIALNVQSLSNGAVASASLSQTSVTIDQSQYTAFFNQLKALGTIAVANTGNPTGMTCDAQNYCAVGDVLPPTEFTIAPGSAPTSTGYTTNSFPTGLIAAGSNLTVSGGALTNAGFLYAGNDVIVNAVSLNNAGGNSQNFSSQVGCASGVPNSACDNGGSPRGNNPNTTTFSYTQNDASIYAGHDLVIAAGQINNTDGNLLAGHDIVIGGVGTTANSTTPAQSLNNTSGNIVAGNDITLNVSGAITNSLPPPVQVHQNYGTKEEYTGCMTAGGYKESYCEAYVDQQSGSSSVISAGNSLSINAGSLTNIGSLISAGTSATINVAGPVVNEAQTLNAYWHSEWVQETGMFSSDKRHNVWACGSAAECTALYGSAYTSVGGAIDPPTPVGNIAATIQAPNLSISSGGQIQNVGNVLGTYVSLTGQKLINGITTANTYTPTVNAPSQVISLTPQTLPGLNLSTPRSVGTPLPTAVAGTAAYVDGVLGSQSSLLGPQQLINALPASLQPSSTLFYYNPQEEDLMLQQAALQQTGQASFVTGLSYDSTSNLSMTEQEKGILYENALTYAEQNNVQLGTALTQTQVNALTQPMLWYVEQTVPDPTCQATGSATCPTITALMPQVYLPENWNALSAGGNIEASQSLSLDFGSAATGGSITNTGTITSSGTLTVNTGTLTNEANQVNVGQIWNSVKGGYTDTTGTEVQPGGFMSAADMSLNVATLNQIGGALQQLNADGTVDQAGTQQLLAQLQQQLGGDFTQTTLSNNLNTSFTAEGGFGIGQLVGMIAAVVASYFLGPELLAMYNALLDPIYFMAFSPMLSLAVGAAATGLAAGTTALVAGAAEQLISTGNLDLSQDLKGAGIAALTAGLTQGLAGTTGITNLGGIITQADSSITLASIGNTVENVGSQALIGAAAQTAIEGGSFGTALANNLAQDTAAVGANAIGTYVPSGTIGYELAHAALGCAASAAEGTGCAGGAIGGATSALIAPLVRDGLYDGSQTVTTTDNGDGTLTQTTSYNNSAFNALTAGIATLSGGLVAGLAGTNAQAGATSAENEVLNNSLSDKVEQLKKWAQWTFADPAGDIARWVGQFGGLVQSGAQQTVSQSGWSLAAQGISNGLSAVLGIGGGLPPAGPDLAPVAVGSGTGQTTSLVSGGAPSNATLASNNGTDESNSTPANEPATNNAGGDSSTLPGMNRPVRAPNPDYPPNSTVVNAMDSPQMRAMVADTDCGDCSDIASYLYRAAGGQGQVIEVSPTTPNNLNVYENGSLESGQSYHQVYTDGQYVYDPRVSATPIPKGDWLQSMTNTNPGGISISVVKGAK